MMLAIYFERQISGGSGSSSRRSSYKMQMSASEGAVSLVHEAYCPYASLPPALPPTTPAPTDTRHPLSCSICRDKYKNPKVLPCLHTFCESCLIAYLPHQSLTLTCPQCRQQSILPLHGIPALQTNFCVSSLSMDSVGGGGSGKSQSSSSSSAPDTELSPGPDPQKYLLCPSHAGQTLRFFCRDCDTAVCSSCTDIEHRRHATIRVNDAVAEEKLRLGELLEGIRGRVKLLEEGVGAADEAAKELEIRRVQGAEEISAAFDTLEKRLRERKEALLEELGRQTSVKLEIIEKSRSLLAARLQDVEECCQLTETALGHENETEILFIKKQIGERLEEYANMECNPKSIHQSLDASLEFERLSVDRVDTSMLGRVVSSVHKGWAISGDSVESRCVPIGRRHFLRLHHLGSPTPTGDINLDDVHVSASTKDVVYSLEAPREGDSRAFIIRFLVSRIGSFSLSVCIKNQHISGSPFQFHAYDGANDDRSASSSPAPHLQFPNGSGRSCSSAAASPTGNGPGSLTSRIPRASLNGCVSPRSRMSTPTKRFYSNGYISKGNGSSSRRSATLEDDLILKIGCRGRGRGEFTNPQAVVAAANGRLVVADSNNQCIQIFDNTGEIKLRFGVRGRNLGQLQRPVGLAIMANTGNIAVADYDNRWISIFDPTGKFMSRMGHGKLLGPKGLTVDSAGHLYVVDNKASCILVFSPQGKLLNKFGRRGCDEGQFAGPHFIAINSKGNIIVSDFHNHCVKVFDSEGDYLFSFGSNGEGNGQFNAPTGIAVDKNDNILVADWGNSRIQIFDCGGSFQSYISTGMEPLYGPQGLTITPDGYVAIADSGNHCVKLYKYG